MSLIGNIALLVLAGGGFVHVLIWLLHRHRHRWTLHSHSIGPRGIGATAFEVTACLECDLCGQRLNLHRMGADEASGILVHSREGALVWLSAQSASKVSSHLRESIVAKKPPGSAA
jgi:hypothetical protein